MLNRKKTHVMFAMAAISALFLEGCKSGGQKPEPLAAGNYPPGLPASAAKQGDTRSPASAVASTPLPPVQQANMTRREYCPVTGAKLGSMGAPIPVAIGSQTVYVCCAGCVEKLRQNPEQYMGPGFSTPASSANYQPRPDDGSSSRSTSSSTNDTGSCGSGSCAITSASSSRSGSCDGSCCH